MAENTVMRPLLIVMGVSGSGKSTVGRSLAARILVKFQEGDELHLAANIAKMSAGVPLTDEDRWPWLDACRDWLEERARAHEGGILACSALKRVYRDRLVNGLPLQKPFIYLRAGKDQLAARMKARPGHFMPASLLESQLETLEEPSEEEALVSLDSTRPVAETIEAILRALPGAV